MIRTIVSMSALFAALGAGTASAQALQAGDGPRDRGPSLGISVSSGLLRTDVRQGGQPVAGGVGLTLGYGLNSSTRLFLRQHYGYEQSQTELGARYTFGGPTRTLRPYVEVAVGRLASGVGDVRASGLGVTGAAGVEYALRRNVALDLGVSHSTGRYDLAIPSTASRKHSITRLNVGLRLRL